MDRMSAKKESKYTNLITYYSKQYFGFSVEVIKMVRWFNCVFFSSYFIIIESYRIVMILHISFVINSQTGTKVKQ